MEVSVRAFFLHNVLLHIEGYLFLLSPPDIIGFWKRVVENQYPLLHFIHARALFYFFYKDKIKKDDIICKDYGYCSRGDGSPYKTLIDSISKGIAHITISRTTKVQWETGVKLESLLVPEIKRFLEYILQDSELVYWLDQFKDRNYQSRITALLQRCEDYPNMIIS